MNWIKRQARLRPNKPFINEHTFADVDRLVDDLAGRLYPFVKDRSRVGLMAYNTLETILFFFALQTLQREVLIINTRLTGGEISNILTNLHIPCVFGPELNAPFTAAQTEFYPYKKVWQNSINSYPLFPKAFSFEQVSVIMTTSGTTGTYKSVPLRWKQLIAHAQASQEVLGVSDEDIWLMVLPMYHIGGLAVPIRCLYSGISIILLEWFDEERVLELTAKGTVNILSMVPTMLKRLVGRITEHHLRVVLCGGEFMHKDTVEQCIAKKIPLFKTYGMTENTSQITCFNMLLAQEKRYSVGPPLPGLSIMIDDPDAEGIGEICIKGTTLMDGYLDQPPIEGFFHTQDIGRLDEDGFLYVLDRRKNIIISGGENIYPQEIENLLYAHEAIKECAVVGTKDEKWGQVPVLYVVTDLDEASIREYLAAKVARFKLPKHIVRINELPKNSTGKLDRYKLYEMAKL